MSESRTIGDLFFLERQRKDKFPKEAKKGTDESGLVSRIRAGDQAAFDELYKKLSPLVYGIVLARVPREEVDDIVQEVFIAAYNKLHKLRDTNAVAPWIATIARNRAIEYYRRKKPTEELSDDLRQKDSRKNEAREILDTIREMPESYRETLILRLVEGMTGPEIAERTGLTHSSVRVNLHRGMKMLRSRLGIRSEKL